MKKAKTNNDLTPITHGMDIYHLVLGKYYNEVRGGELTDNNFLVYPNPFNHDRPTLRIAADGSRHFDTEEAIKAGNHYDFATLYYKMYGSQLLKAIATDHLNNGNPERKIPIVLEKDPEVAFSYFKRPITSVRPLRDITPVELYGLIKSDCFKDETLKLRSITDRTEARKYKAANFDYITAAGTFSQRNVNGLKHHSGLLVIDFDHVKDPPALGLQLLNDQYFVTALYFISPSGDGLKWIIEIDPADAFRKVYFNVICQYLEDKYKCAPDKGCSDVTRACFLPHDPNVYINPKFI
jgi:hypothetical protein